MAATKRNMVIADGRRAGINAASWVFDGNTDQAAYARVLQGIEDGDPEILDSVRVPNLSGEFAGDPTPQSIADEYSINDSDQLDKLCSLWEDAASQAFWDEVTKTCRKMAA